MSAAHVRRNTECVPGLRSCLRHLGIYGFLSVVAVGLTQLAPAPFLDWWWDQASLPRLPTAFRARG